MWKLVLTFTVVSSFFITLSEANKKKCRNPNEVFDRCLNPCPARQCGVDNPLILCAPALKPGSLKCKRGSNKYPKNETLDPCYSSCPPRYCGVKIAAVLCAEQTECNPGCRCKDGYLKNATRCCIRETDCPTCEEPNQTYDVCIDPCPRNRCDVDERLIKCAAPPQPGDPNCQAGCRCADGFVRTVEGNCVTRDQCPPVCGKDEVSSECIQGECRPKTCSQLGNPIACPRIDPKKCIKGCICKEKYVRAANGTCIPKEKCPPVCGKNEVYSECTNGGCQARNCSQLEQPVPCVKLDPESCIKGCVCKEGYLRARNGTCVLEKDCDNCNKPHEYYDPCAQSCPPQTCESIGRQYKCPITAAVCRGACKCKKEYFRNRIGECISKENCLKCKGPNEYFSCGSACDNECDKLYKQNQTNCPIVNIKCNPMCYCEEGYARDKNKKCIPIDQCPVPTCGKYERFVQCPPALCVPRKCTDVGFPAACPDLSENGCPESPDCVCIENYVRDAKGKCVPIKNCRSCGGDPNAESGCGLNCGRLCSNYKEKDVACIAICYYNACDCKKGYVFDENLQKCVKPKNCSPTCKKNEVYDTCANGGCQKRNCSQLGQPDICIDVIKSIGGCVCKEGYLRAKNGTCIPQNQCPAPTCGKNERFVQCPPYLCEPQYCSEVGYPITCPKVTNDPAKCPGQPACVCNSGYVKDDTGVCVPKKQCPSCGGDPNGVAGCGVNCGKLCSNYNKGPVPCPKICKLNSCDCKEGFVFDSNIKKCVRPKECTTTCGKNEVYDSCANGGCQKRNCSQVGQPDLCIDPIKCIGGCVCQEGYLRLKNGTCVPQDQCPLNCTGPHEFFACGGACDNVCLTLNEQNQTDCPIINIKCNPMCYCEKGYARDENGICILIKKCPPPRCGLNQRYEEDPSSICEPQFCSELGFPMNCETLDQGTTTSMCEQTTPAPACLCKFGYVRDKDGNCIPKSECPSCGGDPHAVSGCGTNCGRRCSDIGRKVTCFPMCYPYGCDCREGFYYNDDTKKCVAYKDCCK